MAGEEEQEFRQRIIGRFNQHGALDLMIETLQSVAADLSEVGR
jgi:CRISPR-associated protein Cas1